MGKVDNSWITKIDLAFWFFAIINFIAGVFFYICKSYYVILFMFVFCVIAFICVLLFFSRLENFLIKNRKKALLYAGFVSLLILTLSPIFFQFISYLFEDIKEYYKFFGAVFATIVALPVLCVLWLHRHTDKQKELENAKESILNSELFKIQDLIIKKATELDRELALDWLKILSEDKKNKKLLRRIQKIILYFINSLFINCDEDKQDLNHRRVKVVKVIDLFRENDESLEEGNRILLNLKGANLSRENLNGVNLRGAKLNEANLKGANLEGADLGGVNLNGANLEGADLGGADLGGANLNGANLEGADLGGANLNGVNLNGANLEGADLGGTNLNGVSLNGANLKEVNLKGSYYYIGDNKKEFITKEYLKDKKIKDYVKVIDHIKGLC